MKDQPVPTSLVVGARPPAAVRAWLDGALRALGQRQGKARAAVLEVMAAQPNHFTLESLFALQPDASRATIFRVLRGLLDANLICLVSISDGDDAYRINRGDHHHHLVCVACGDVRDVPIVEIDAALERLARAEGFEPSAHRVDVFGRCATCLADVDVSGAGPS